MGEKDICDMPLRVIGYDGMVYRSQLLKTQTGEKCSSQERQRRYPVVTLVLYFGYEHRWDKPLNLVDCLKIPEEFLKNNKKNLKLDSSRFITCPHRVGLVGIFLIPMQSKQFREIQKERLFQKMKSVILDIRKRKTAEMERRRFWRWAERWQLGFRILKKSEKNTIFI